MRVQQRQIRVARVGIVLNGEGEEGRAIRGPSLPDGTVGERVEAPTFARWEGRIFDPELELAVDADRGEEIGVEGGREPL